MNDLKINFDLQTEGRKVALVILFKNNTKEKFYSPQ